MAQKKIIFRLTAFSAAAGKYNPDAPLDGNEDNFYVDDDLSDDILGRFQTDEDITMSECGCLMVVADGMGGMNAGEVASELAIETVKDFFAPGRITPHIAESSIERRKYLELVIKEADRRIKTDAKENPDHEGMGSTIILAWIVGNKMTVSWCGDSRAYRFNPINGLELLSCDHSYVQELVNQGALKYEDTFEHPQGNIVTRSLGDPNKAAKPETKQFDVYNEDIILLCSDGLSGVLRDRKTKDHNGSYYPGENIEDIMSSHTSSMTECRNALLEAAENADWYDNVTVLLCQIESGAGEAPKRQFVEQDNTTAGTIKGQKSLKHKIFFSAGIGVILITLLCGTFYYLGIRKGKTAKTEQSDIITHNDSINNTDVVLGEDVTEREPEKMRVKDNSKPKEQKGRKADKNNITNPTNIDPKTAPTNNHPEVSPWKIPLLDQLKKKYPEGLRNIVANVCNTIYSAGDGNEDQTKCKNLVDQVNNRISNLNELNNYNSTNLTTTGKTEFNILHSEICNPKVYNPKIWELRIKNLSKYSSKSSDHNKKELSPVNDDIEGNKEGTDSPDELNEVKTNTKLK